MITASALTIRYSAYPRFHPFRATGSIYYPAVGKERLQIFIMGQPLPCFRYFSRRYILKLPGNIADHDALAIAESLGQIAGFQ
ncbi:hypothetical protein KAB67_000411 [Salmonella enterica]|nr:hypothetical protein [Salmonella enterica]